MSYSGQKRSGRIASNVEKRVKSIRADIDQEGQDIAQAIIDELENSSSSESWTGEHEEDKKSNRALIGDWATYRLDASTVTKSRIQIVGKAHGCHTCLTRAEKDRDQPWTGDHCPPTKLSPAARKHLSTPAETHLFPQCKNCSDQQSALVKQLKTMPEQDTKLFLNGLAPARVALLTGGRKPVTIDGKQNCIQSFTPDVKPDEGLKIQQIGSRIKTGGCHTCDTPYPCSYYIADHVVPKFLVSEGFRQLFLALNIDLPKLVFRPQCQRCSNGQGGAVSQLAVRARAWGMSKGIVFTEAQT